MNPIFKLLSIAFVIAICISCEKADKNPALDDFCSAAPAGWNCEIVRDNFDIRDYPKNADVPLAVIKYQNPDRAFEKYVDTPVSSSLILDFYPIAQKQELITFIKSQQMYSWCIPIYYGETKEYFIITSPCFINSGTFTDEADACIEDLHNALEELITKNSY
ncbi:hypothetical protein ACE01N_12800 [Saccharicrinis sp. FJH2]|uniref:hypothetical protein n=1 Tax=Saccharicrinis sp. FJH65 TaxID=3344659 RepID=UPI0035F2D0ED